MSDLSVSPAAAQPATPAPRNSPALAVAAIGTLFVGLALIVIQVWQWRGEAREAWEALRATIAARDTAARPEPPPREPAIARAVVDLIKIELPPLLAPITLLPAEPPARAEPEADLVLRQIVPFPRAGSEGDGEIERAIGALTAQWRKHAANGACTIAVDGHTDTKGSDEANRLLSERRATFVAKVLAREFSSARITVNGWGERRLLVLTPDGTDELANRRVEVTLTCPAVAVAMN